MDSEILETNQPSDNEQAALPRRISFKYRSAHAAQRCLSDGQAYFAAPSEFNDCLEARFDHSTAADYIARMDQSIRDIVQQSFKITHPLDLGATDFITCDDKWSVKQI